MLQSSLASLSLSLACYFKLLLLATNIAKLSDLLAIVFVAEQVVFDTDGIFMKEFFEKKKGKKSADDKNDPALKRVN